MAGGKLRKLFTNIEIEEARDGYDRPWERLTELKGVPISRQTYDYWIKHLELLKNNGEPYIGTTVLDRKIREGLTLRVPSMDDDKSITPVAPTNERILHVPDLHAPYHHRDAIEFLTDVKELIQPTRVINLGDETDQHAMSMHDSDPSLDAAGPELLKAQVLLQELVELFPDMEFCHSNHGSLIYRRAFKFGIPAAYIKTYRDFLFPFGGAEGWSWHDEIRVELPDGSWVTYRHHFQGNKNTVGHGLRSHIVQGHEHSKFYIVYDQTSVVQNWSMVSGCLIDAPSEAFAYGKLMEGKPIIGCSAIINSQPILIPMPVDEDGRYTGKLTGAYA